MGYYDIGMDETYLLNLCAFAKKKARTYYEMVEYSLPEKDKEKVTLEELRGIRQCLLFALDLANKMLKEAGDE